MIDKLYNPIGAHPRAEPLPPGSKINFAPQPAPPMTHMRIEITRGQRGDFGYEISVSVDRPMDYPDAQRGMQWTSEELASLTRFAGQIAKHELRYHEGETNLPHWSYPGGTFTSDENGAIVFEPAGLPDYDGAPEPEEPTGEVEYDTD